MTPKRHSPSSLNLFCACREMYVLEKILDRRQPVGTVAHRGTSVEDGLTLGLLDPSASVDACVAKAEATFDRVSALNPDPRREQHRRDIPGMVASALEELRPYGVPSRCQGSVQWHPEGLKMPIFGYFDYEWAEHGIIVDLKTSETLPSAVKTPHCRQVALYAVSDNYDGRAAYVTPKKRATYRIDDIGRHRDALHSIALKVERFLSLSDDPQFFVEITAPDLDSFYWKSPQARQAAWEVWGI